MRAGVIPVVSVFRNRTADVPPIELRGIASAKRNIEGVPPDVPPVPIGPLKSLRCGIDDSGSAVCALFLPLVANVHVKSWCAVCYLATPMFWRCLVDDELRSHAIAAIGDIVGAAAGDGVTVDRAFLVAYAGQARGDEAMLERANALLDDALDHLNTEGSAAPGLWGGLADVRFALAHMVEGDEGDDALRVIDDALLEGLASIEGCIDLIGGLAGIGVAALEDPTRGHGRELATRALDAIERCSERDEHGVTWCTPPHLLPAWQRERCPDGYWNLGLAHGIPGVIGFLAAMVTVDIEAPRARALLDGAVPWLLATSPPRTRARFLHWRSRGNGADNDAARLAWCYGDAGVAITLLAAARALDRKDWDAEARAMAKAMAARPFEQSGVLDAGICHGAAGVAHIFNRLYQATRDDELRDAACRWYRQLLAMRRPGEGIAGFPARNHVDGADVWIADDSVLMGASGVGLALLAAVTDLEPAWDRALLCGVPPLERV